MRQPSSSPNRWPGWSLGKLIFFTLLFLFFGVGLTVQSFVYRSNNAKFDGPVVHVRGVVDDVVQIEGAGTSKGPGHSTHRVAYHFDAPDGHHRVVTGATVATCNSLNSGDPVPVKYLPGDPSSSRLDLPREDASHHQEVWVDLAAGTGLLALAGVFFRKWLQG